MSKDEDRRARDATEHQVANDGLTEMEIHRLKAKHRLMETVSDIGSDYSLWQSTIDLVMRTNLHESSRVEELWHLRGLVSRMTDRAQEIAMPRAALGRLAATLGMLMPREWFHDHDTRRQVRDDIRDANVEVQDLHHAWRIRAVTPSHPEHDQEPTTPRADDLSPQTFFLLAQRTFKEAHSILVFQLSGSPLRQEVDRTATPPHLRAPIDEMHAAERAVSDAEHAPCDAPEGRNLAIEMANKRLANAQKLVNETEPERRAVEQQVYADWLRQHRADLGDLVRDYEPAFEHHRLDLAGSVDITSMPIGRLGDSPTSACQVLLWFAKAAITDATLDRFDQMDPERIWSACEKEIGVLKRASGPDAKSIESDNRPRERPMRSPTIGTGGPAKTLDAVCRAILEAKGQGAALVAGDTTEHATVMHNLKEQDRKKAADYLAPSGSLCKGSWITRDGDLVTLTAQGAKAGTARITREAERKQRKP